MTRHTIRSDAWDLQELCNEMVNHLERLAHDPPAMLDRKRVEDWRTRFTTLSLHLRDDCMKERLKEV